MKCKTLLGNGNIDFTIDCLNSFVNNCEDGIDLEIFEDGSLTDENKIRLRSEIRGVSIVSKQERDARMNSLLAAYPSCLEYRNTTIFAHKLFDVMLFNENEKELLFIDSDVYFFDKFRLPVLSEFPVFICDKQNAYSFSPAEFLTIEHPISPKINTGLFYFPKSLFSLSHLEELLSNPIIKRGVDRISWIEQTLWAFMAARAEKVFFFHPKQLIMAAEKLKLTEKTLAVHLVSTFRHHYSQLTELKSKQDSAVQLRLKENLRTLGKVNFIAERAKKSANRRLGLK